MIPASAPDLAALRRASRLAAGITLAGVCVALASISYGVWNLYDTKNDLKYAKDELTATGEKLTVAKQQMTDLDGRISALHKEEARLRGLADQAKSELAALQKQIADIAGSINVSKKGETKLKPPAIDQIKDAVAEKAELERQVTVLRKEATIIRDELRERFKDPAKNVELWAKPEYRGVMTTVLVRPTSRYIERDDPSSPTGKWYVFTLALDFPDEPKLAAVMKQDIKSVTFDMNHPYLKVPPLVSTKADNDFAVEYKGAGTLRNVVVKIDIADVRSPVLLDYDMMKAHPEAKKK